MNNTKCSLCDDEEHPAILYVNVTTLQGVLITREALCVSCAWDTGLMTQGDIEAAEKEKP